MPEINGYEVSREIAHIRDTDRGRIPPHRPDRMGAGKNQTVTTAGSITISSKPPDIDKLRELLRPQARANSGVVMMNHVGINVPNVAEAVTSCTEKMGYRKRSASTTTRGR